MPAQPRKTTRAAQLKKDAVGGVEVTEEEIRLAIETLVTASGVMVAQPLRKVGSVLAACDYYGVADEERKLSSE